MFIFFIFIVFFLFLSCSNVCALEDDNSTDVLQEDVVCEPVLSEDIGGVNDTRLDTYLNSSNVVKYYHGPECYGAYLCDGEGNVLSNKNG